MQLCANHFTVLIWILLIGLICFWSVVPSNIWNMPSDSEDFLLKLHYNYLIAFFIFHEFLCYWIFSDRQVWCLSSNLNALYKKCFEIKQNNKKFGAFSNCSMITRISAYINFFTKQQVWIVNMKCSYLQIISQFLHEYLPVWEIAKVERGVCKYILFCIPLWLFRFLSEF